MLFSVNGVGNLGGDCEVRVTTETSKLVTFSVAASERVKNEAGQWVDRASFYPVKVWLAKASTLDSYLKKGQTVQVQGALVEERWEKDGQRHSRLVLDCSAAGHGVGLVGSKRENAESTNSAENPLPKPQGNSSAKPAAKPAPAPTPQIDINDDEIPF